MNSSLLSISKLGLAGQTELQSTASSTKIGDDTDLGALLMQLGQTEVNAEDSMVDMNGLPSIPDHHGLTSFENFDIDWTCFESNTLLPSETPSSTSSHLSDSPSSHEGSPVTPSSSFFAQPLSLDNLQKPAVPKIQTATATDDSELHSFDINGFKFEGLHSYDKEQLAQFDFINEDYSPISVSSENQLLTPPDKERFLYNGMQMQMPVVENNPALQLSQGLALYLGESAAAPSFASEPLLTELGLGLESGPSTNIRKVSKTRRGRSSKAVHRAHTPYERPTGYDEDRGERIVVVDEDGKLVRKFQCSVCFALIGRRPDLTRHRKTCIEKINFECTAITHSDGSVWEGCGTTFARRDASYRHLKNRLEKGHCGSSSHPTPRARNAFSDSGSGSGSDSTLGRMNDLRASFAKKKWRQNLPAAEKNRLAATVLSGIKQPMFR